MTASTEKQCKCRLCGDYFSDSEMSEEHYPARNTGNEDIVAVDLGKMFDTFISENVHAEIRQKLDNGQTLESIAGDILNIRLLKQFTQNFFQYQRRGTKNLIFWIS